MNSLSSTSEKLPASDELAGGRLTIDLGAIADNWRKLNAMTPDAECAAVVKANAYGLGISRVVPTLWRAGCRIFFVALPEEGIAVRKAAPEATIYILCGFLPDAAKTYLNHQLRPVLSARADEWLAIGRATNAPYAVQLETGMNRLGMDVADYAAFMESADYPPSLQISHLACADTPKHALNQHQRQNFDSAVKLAPQIPKSLANSAGIFLSADYHHDLVRPGIALYGGASAETHLAQNPMKPVVRVESRILQIKFVPVGQTIGYGAHETVLPTDGHFRITATLACGYADGYLRSCSSSDSAKGGFAAWRGQKVPLIGRVSMDLISVDMTDHPKLNDLRDQSWKDEWIELIGPTITLDEVASAAGTIGYELLTGLGQRFHKIYINDNN